MHVEEGGLSRNLDAKQIGDLVATNVRGHCEVIEVVRQGNAAEQILLVAREHDVDVIALTAKHRLFLDLTIIGNTTEKVMRHADSAVLVLPAGGGQIIRPFRTR
jgi:nucleotide-binding universal stress UspA family protein